MTIEEIKAAMAASDCAVFGLRCDRPGIAPGTVLPNSRQWFQDYQEWWTPLPDPDDYDSNPDHPYNSAIECWDDGELPGVCAIYLCGDGSNVAEALAAVQSYRFGGHTAVYLVAGESGVYGNDIGEVIIYQGTVIATVDG